MKTNSRKKTVLVALLVAAILVAWRLNLFSPSQTVAKKPAPPQANGSQVVSIRKHLVKKGDAAAPVADRNEKPATGLTPHPMQLAKRVLVQNRWNDGEFAFGREGGREGATIGPSAMVCDKDGNSYVMDNVRGRVLKYDRNGNLLAAVPTPTKTPSDMVINPEDGSLLLVDLIHDTVYRVSGEEVTLFDKVAMSDAYGLGTRFHFDPGTHSIAAEDRLGTAAIRDGKLVLGGKSEHPISIDFGKPMLSVLQTSEDAHGTIWVLFALEDDFRMSRLARINPADGTVGVTEIDAWWAYDSFRRMSPTEHGVVVLAGDNDQAQLAAYDYVGTF